MIISHKYKFIFIKTSKTGGTSIEVYLSRYCGEDDVVTPIVPAESGHIPRNHKRLFNPLPELLQKKGMGARKSLGQLRRGIAFYNHMPAYLVKCRIADNIWNNYFKFCVERNPWDRSISHYNMLKNRSMIDYSFDEYLQAGNLCRNLHKYTEYRDNRNVLVDRVLKYESLNEELSDVFGQLGVPFDGNLDVYAKKINRAKKDFRETLSESQIARISELFHDEIKVHGHSVKT